MQSEPSINTKPESSNNPLSPSLRRISKARSSNWPVGITTEEPEKKEEASELKQRPEEEALNPKFPADLSNQDLKDVLKIYTKTEIFRQNLIAKIKILFPEDSENVSIKDYEFTDSHNYASHKIVICGDKKFHFKPTFQCQGTNAGSKFNELFYYKMCEHLGIGPQCHGIIMEDSGALFILTEDLSTRNLKGSSKEISFSTRKQDTEKYKALPSRDTDNIHRVALNLAISLMDLDDLEFNKGNIGIKTSRNIETSETKEKIFLVDFTIREKFGIFISDESMKDYIKSIADLIRILNTDGPIPAQIISDFFIPSSLTQDSLKTAIQKLFIDEEGNPTKMLDAIDKSYNYSLSLIDETTYQTRDGLTLEQDKAIHRKALLERVTKQKEIIQSFMQIPEVKHCLEEKSREIKLKKAIQQTSNGGDSAPTREAPPIKFSRVTQLSEDNERKDDSPSPSTQSAYQTASVSPVSRTDSLLKL
jgi:hypothetical protein